jgi:hypothetical protein
MADNELITPCLQELIKLTTARNELITLQNKMIGHIRNLLSLITIVLILYILYYLFIIVGSFIGY